MDRRNYLRLTGGLVTASLLAGCAGESEEDGGSDSGGNGGGSEDETDSSDNDTSNGDGGSSDNTTSDDSGDSGPTPGEQAAGENVEEYNGLVIQEHELVVEEESGIESVTIEGIVENTTDSTVGYVEVSARVYDSDGNQLNSYFTNTNDLQAGGTWKFEVMVIEESDEIEEYDIAVSDSPF